MSRLKRIWYSLRLLLFRSSFKRANFIRDKNLFRNVGTGCMIQIKKIPLYPELIYLHNNVFIASNVLFLTHDAIHGMLNMKFETKSFNENLGCIEIMDNVFVGANSIIMPDVRIGENTIIAAGSVVTKDIPSNSIFAGVPAKKIGDFNDLVQKRSVLFQDSLPTSNKQSISDSSINILWDKFTANRTTLNVKDKS